MSMSARYQLQQQRPQSHPQQDYFQPLHVDCSVEYELPECAKPPQGVKIEPLLMIHPCHFRNLERQRRRPFENNLPVGKQRVATKKTRSVAAVPYPPAWDSCRIPSTHSHSQIQMQMQMQELPVYSCQALAAWGARDCHQQMISQPLPRPCYEAV